MIDVDERIRAEVDRLVPAPSGFAADWGDVLTRSGPSRPSRAGRRRLLVLAATVAFSAVPTPTSPTDTIAWPVRSVNSA